jgi:predicted transcriptional regulator
MKNKEKYIVFNNLAEIVKSRMITAQEITYASDVPYYGVSKAINGKPVKKSTARKILEGLKIDPAEAFSKGIIKYYED